MLAKALNDNQLLILSRVDSEQTMSSLLAFLSESYNIPLSTLKFNFWVLKDLGLVSIGTGPEAGAVRLTGAGKLVLSIILDGFSTSCIYDKK